MAASYGLMDARLHVTMHWRLAMMAEMWQTRFRLVTMLLEMMLAPLMLPRLIAVTTNNLF
jgi:hypothetical protein